MVEQQKASLSPVRVWLLAARPATLGASVSPVVAGAAVAVHDHAFRAPLTLGALLVAVAMQVGVNYANDYSDHVRGADRRRVGPIRVASSGLVPPGQVRLAAVAAFTVAAAAGLAVSLATDWRLLILGALAVAAGWLYTGGPRPYGYLGLGELFVFVFFGLFAAAGATYVNELRVPPAAWTAGVATGCLACAILAINNLRDIATDTAAGKRTLAVRIGRSWTRPLATQPSTTASTVNVPGGPHSTKRRCATRPHGRRLAWCSTTVDTTTSEADNLSWWARWLTASVVLRQMIATSSPSGRRPANARLDSRAPS